MKNKKTNLVIDDVRWREGDSWWAKQLDTNLIHINSRLKFFYWEIIRN